MTLGNMSFTLHWTSVSSNPHQRHLCTATPFRSSSQCQSIPCTKQGGTGQKMMVSLHASGNLISNSSLACSYGVTNLILLQSRVCPKKKIHPTSAGGLWLYTAKRYVIFRIATYGHGFMYIAILV